MSKYPPEPHPRHRSGGLDLPSLKEDPMINQLKEDLDDIKKDIDLNYSRLDYNSKAVDLTLTMISHLLGYAISLISELQKEENSEDKKDVDYGYGNF